MEEPLQQSVDVDGDDAFSSSSFDYIVVGAGSSCMGFLAGLLQADDFYVSVAVVERGDDGDGSADDSLENNEEEVAHWYRDSHHNHDDSSHSSTKLLTASCWGHRRLRVPTGCGLGGTSRIHASLCLSPAVADDNLDEDWSEPCRSQLRKSLDCIQQVLDQNQALHVFHHADHHPHHSAEICSRDSKNKKNDDDDDDDDNIDNDNDDPSNVQPRIRTRSLPCRCTVTKDGKYRMNYYKAIVAPLLHAAHKRGRGGRRTNIQWFTRCVVQNLVVDPLSSQTRDDDKDDKPVMIVKGVKFWNEVTQTHQTLYAKRKVILSAGVFASPAILLASGLLPNSPRSNSRSSCISHEPATATCNKEDEWIDLPLMDHVMIPCAMLSWRPLVSSQKQLSWNGVQCLHQVDYDDPGNSVKKRFLVARMDATVHADILPSVLVDLLLCRRESWPPFLARLLEGIARWAILWTPLGWILRYHVITMAIFCMNPNTTGNKLSLRRKRNMDTTVVSAASALLDRNSQVEVKIDLPYLKDEQDLVALQAVWEECKKLVAPPFAIEFFPSVLIRRGPLGFFQAYCRAVCLPFFHWCGTLPLGGSLVDRHFGVRHVESLCICDASVFPRQVSVPPALTCAALGHCLASLLRQQEQDDGDDTQR